MSKQPDPVRIVLVGQQTHRDTTAGKDFRFVNVIFEILDNETTQQRKVFVLRRPGYSQHTFPPAGAATVRGMHYWDRTGSVYSVSDDILYKDETAIQTINTSTGPVSFTETDGAPKYLVMVDGTDGWVVETNDTVTDISGPAPDFPTPHVPQVENIDGYVFVIDSITGEVYNSNINDPLVWNTTNFFTPEMYPDLATGMSRYRNLLVVFGINSTEFFFDAANSTGSPMSRVEQMSQEIGCAAFSTIARTQDNLFFVAQTKAGRWVAGLEEEKFIPLSSPPINRILEAEEENITSAEGMILYVKGHPVYVLNLVGANRTFVYDPSMKIWSEWTSDISGVQEKFSGAYATAIANGNQLIQHRTDGHIYVIEPEVYLDDTTNIAVALTTNLFDGDTNKRKFIRRFELVGDRTTTPSLVSISWTDDDYQTFSTPRTLDMSGHMFLRSIGAPRRRGFRLEHSDNVPFRMEAIELEYDEGVW